MKIGRHNLFKAIFWVWMLVLFVGLNQTLTFISPNMLLLAMVLFFLVDLVLDLAGIILKLFVSLVLIHRTFYVGNLFNPQWLRWLRTDLSEEFSALLSGGWIAPAPVMGMALTFIILIIIQRIYASFHSRSYLAMVLFIVGSVILAAASVQFNGAPGHVVLYVVVGLMVLGTARLQKTVVFPMKRWLSVLLVWALCLTSIAWALPAGHLDFSEWYNEFRNTVDDSIPGVYDPGGSPRFARVGYSSFDGNLGGPLVNDYTLIMEITSPSPVYLRGETRNYYTGRGWRTDSWESMSPDTELRPAHIQGKEVTITVEIIVEERRVMFVPRYPLSFEFSRDMDYTIMRPSRLPPETHDLYGDFEFRRTESLYPGDTYTMSVLLPYDNPEDLRQLTNDLPLDDRYLQLPADLPQRVTDLALDITSEADNGYDRVMALVDYLRYGKWGYSLATDSTPTGEDFVDWFLFEQEEGYCVHFATAFVVLARAAGLPARWIKGYTSGVPDELGHYSILRSNSHTWAEVWFDNYGWVPFEPTPGAVMPTVGMDDETPGREPPPLTEQPGQPIPPEPGPGQDSGDIQGTGSAWNWMYAALILLIVLAVVGAGTGVLVLATLPRALGKTVSMTKTYAKLQNRLKLFGWQRHSWETPQEHLNRVDLPNRPLLAGFIQKFEGSFYGGDKTKVVASEERSLRTRFSVFSLALYRLTTRR